jgi:hypothetical protein
MLKLVKSTSSENYPITPQTSAVRKLSVKASGVSVVDLSSSYLLVKNSLQTTVNGANVVRNVSWGCYFNDDSIVEYPATCQVSYAELKIRGQTVEYVEDVNVRLVNLMTYRKNAEQVKKEANLGSYGFQRLENGPKAESPAVAAENQRSQGAYRSPFLSQTLDATSQQVTGSTYQEVASVLKLSDLFSFCQAGGVDNLNVSGDVEIILQFEDRAQILTEYVNFLADVDIVSPAGELKPKTQNTLSLQKFVSYEDDSPIITDDLPASLAAFDVSGIRFKTTNTYKHVADVPLYQGMPFCVWKDTALPATKGSNVFTVHELLLDASGSCIIDCKLYKNAVGEYIHPTTGTALTVPNIIDAIGEPNATVTDPITPNIVALSGIVDPVVSGTTATNYKTNRDNGLNSKYVVSGLELVVVEKMNAPATKQKIAYMQYMRDSDNITGSTTNYQKSFPLEPATAGVFVFLPPDLDTRPNEDANLLSVSHMKAPDTVVSSAGLEVRTLINSNPLYTRDIQFSSTTDTVSPLFVHRLYLASQQLQMPLNNLSTVQHFMAKDGVTQHCMVCEPVPVSQNDQLLTLRLKFDTNTRGRTIYLYKAQMRMLDM